MTLSRPWLLFAFLFVAPTSSAQPPPALTATTAVWSDGHEVQASGNGPSVIALSRAADGSVLVREDAPTDDFRALGRCARARGSVVARCPRAVTRVKVLFAADAAHRLVVAPGARLGVAVFSLEGGDDAFDLRGATTIEARCGPGRDTVLATDAVRIWGDCEVVNSRAWQVRTRLGAVRGAELDAAPGGIAWIDPNGLLHLRARLNATERVVQPPVAMRFGRLDVGLDAAGRAIATVAICDPANRCGRWQSLVIASAVREPLRLVPPHGCRLGFVARWRTRTALGVDCPQRGGVMLAGGGHSLRYAFPSQLGAGYAHGAPAVDLRGDLLTADFDRGVSDELWAMRTGPRPCRRLLDVAAPSSEGFPSGVGRVRIAAGGRVLWPYTVWGTVARVGPSCALRWRYELPDRVSQAMTVVGHTLLRASHGRLTAEPLATVPPPLWPVGNPWDWSDDVIL